MEMFSRITDPIRLRAGDFILCPANTPALNVATSTLGKWGLSIGSTCRSENYRHNIKLWMSRKLGASAPRMFLVAHAVKGSLNQEPPAYLLGLGKKVAKPDEPEAVYAQLVPYVRENAADNPPIFTYGQWVGAWNKAMDNRVHKALQALHSASKTGGLVVGTYQNEFTALTDVWESSARTLRPLGQSEEAKGCWSVNYWLPTVNRSRESVQPDTFRLDFMTWGGGWRKDERIHANKMFLKNFFAKGAIVLRPSARLVEALTADAVRWYCGELAKRFKEFAEAGEYYDNRLRADVVKAKACMRTCARTAKHKVKIADALALAEKEGMGCH